MTTFRQCRSPAHCIEWAKLIAWTSQRAGEDFDADTEEHMRWAYERALARAEQFGIQVGVFDTWGTHHGRCKDVEATCAKCVSRRWRAESSLTFMPRV